MDMNTEVTSIDQYIDGCPKELHPVLIQIRKTIQDAAPKATEAIKYGMPTFIFHENLVHFAVCKNHIGFYPNPSALVAFSNEISGYKSSKGAVQFPINQPIPFNLITQMVEFRVKESETKALLRKTKKSKLSNR